jgi:hypothetical protein
MNTLGERSITTVVTLLPPLIMVAGFIALFTGFNVFFALLIWILGFAVLLPIAAILMSQKDELTDEEWWSTWFGWWHPVR